MKDIQWFNKLSLHFIKGLSNGALFYLLITLIKNIVIIQIKWLYLSIIKKQKPHDIGLENHLNLLKQEFYKIDNEKKQKEYREQIEREQIEARKKIFESMPYFEE